MALSSNLPIYKVTYDLLVKIADFTRSMPRDFKRSIGERIREECVALVLLIYRANCAKEKSPHLAELLERLQVAERERDVLGAVARAPLRALSAK